MGSILVEQIIEPSNQPIDQRARSLIEKGRMLLDDVECFGFVPSNYEKAWSALDGMERGRFVEWGSGLGIVTGLAEILGFEASGIELQQELVEKSRDLLAEFELTAEITQGDYLLSDVRADVYFVYCWPGEIIATEARFNEIAGPDDRLLICESQSDIRCKMKA